MKRLTALAIAFFVCFFAFSPTVAFAEYDSEDFTSDYSNFQPGSCGVLCLDENGEEHFISANEILSYSSSLKVALPSSFSEDNTERAIEDASFSAYKPVVYIQSTYANGDITGGTGCYVGPTGILTCAHTIYSRENGWPEKVYVYTDYKNNSNYGNRYEVKAKYIGGEYNENNLDDWGIVTVAESSNRGYYGFKSTSDLSTLLGKSVVVPGYCQFVDKGPFYFVSSKGTIKEEKKRTIPWLIFAGEVEHGLSGAPVLDGSTVLGMMFSKGSGTTSTGEHIDLGFFHVINPWLYNVIYEYSGR